MPKTKKGSKSDLPARSTARAPALPADRLLGDIRSLIEAVRQQVARTVNSGMVALYWHVGKRIREDVLHEQRASYGEDILQTLSAKLVAEYGRGFGARNLANMTRFAETFPEEQIVAALSQQLSWSHFVQIIPLDNPLKRDFYAEMCRVERWSVRTLRHKIDHLLFERTAVAKKPEKLIEQDLAALRDEDRLTPDLVFRDPYLLDFLGLTGSYSEKDVERAVLRELEAFILELGTDFAFVARQKRMTVDDVDYYLDLLFYHRRLRRLVAIDFHPVRYNHAHVPIRVRASKRKRPQQLRWLHKRSEAADCRARCRGGLIHEKPAPAATHLLRGVPESGRCNQARQVSQVGLGKALPEDSAERISHGVKIGQFQAADKGQMELYLRWLEEYEMQPGEEPPLGLILCAGKTEGHVRLLKLEESGIHAAQYLTELPPQELLEQKLHDAIRLARERLARQSQDQLPVSALPAPEKPSPGKKRGRSNRSAN